MKPGVSRARTGVLPRRSASATVASATSGLVAAPLMTSTRGRTGAGLKRGMPTTRSGGEQAPAMLGVEREGGVEARVVAGGRRGGGRRGWGGGGGGGASVWGGGGGGGGGGGVGRGGPPGGGGGGGFFARKNPRRGGGGPPPPPAGPPRRPPNCRLLPA